jgi:SprT protein
VAVLSEILKPGYREILSQHIPESTIDIVLKWIFEKKIQLKVTNSRRSKLGDYRPPLYNSTHRISVNKDLNKYAFLITFIHEYTHLIVWEKYKNRVKPHGYEWKTEYNKIISLFLNKETFPAEIIDMINRSLNNLKSSTSNNIALSRCLSNYDEQKNNIYIEKLPAKALFILSDGRKFRKEHKLRKRYRCVCIDNNKVYSFHPLAVVLPLIE